MGQRAIVAVMAALLAAACAINPLPTPARETPNDDKGTGLDASQSSAADASWSAPDLGPEPPSLFGECTVTGCADLACVAPGREATIHAIFREILLARLGSDAACLDAHVVVTDVSLREYAGGLVARVEYAFTRDWAVAELYADVRGIDPALDDAAFAAAVRTGLEDAVALERCYAPVPFAGVRAAVEECGGSVDAVDWCDALGIRDGELVFDARVGVLDAAANRCARARVDLGTGAVECGEEECVLRESCEAFGGTECRDGCFYLEDDDAHCGACERACGPTESCHHGECLPAPPCVAPFSACHETYCADLTSDPKNCGACDEWCDDGETCVDGECRCGGSGPDCALPLHCCGTACVDRSSDEASCGVCGRACPEGALCARGRCECLDGDPLCDGACVDEQRDPAHCGRCGHACADGEVCRGGECFQPCATAGASGDCALLGEGACCAALNGESFCFAPERCRASGYLERCGAWAGPCAEGLVCSAYEGSDGPRCVRACTSDGGCPEGGSCEALDAATACLPPPQAAARHARCAVFEGPAACADERVCFAPRTSPEAVEEDEAWGFCADRCEGDADCSGGTRCLCPEYYFTCACVIPCPSGSAAADCPDAGAGWHCAAADPSPYPITLCVPE